MEKRLLMAGCEEEMGGGERGGDAKSWRDGKRGLAGVDCEESQLRAEGRSIVAVGGVCGGETGLWLWFVNCSGGFVVEVLGMRQAQLDAPDVVGGAQLRNWFLRIC